MTYTRYRINTIDSPDDEHRGAGNMWRIYMEKRIVRQVGYLQELNPDARSTKHKKPHISQNTASFHISQSAWSKDILA